MTKVKVFSEDLSDENPTNEKFVEHFRQGMPAVRINSGSHATRHVPSMNSSQMVHLFGLLLSCQVLVAMGLNKLEMHCHFYELSSQGLETMENVLPIFENPAEGFNNDFGAIDLLRDTKDPEIVKYVLSKSVNMDPHRRATILRENLERMLDGPYYHDECELVPGEPSYEIALVYLNEIKHDNHARLNHMYDNSFERLIARGNLPLVKACVDSGFQIPRHISGGIRDIKGDKIGTINFLVENGYNITDCGQDFFSLMKEGNLCVADFELYLQHGLPLDYRFVSQNWLELALEVGCIDIAILFYQRGLRLSKEKLQSGYIYNDMKGNISKFTRKLLLESIFEKAKEMLAGNSSDTSICQFLPIEIVYEIIMAYAGLEEEDCSLELYI